MMRITSSRLWIANTPIILVKMKRSIAFILVHWGPDDLPSTWSELKQTLVSAAVSQYPNRFIFKHRSCQRRVKEVLWNHFQLWATEQKRTWKDVSMCFHSCAWYRREGWGQAACTQCRSGFGRGVWLRAPNLISPSVYSVGPDTSTRVMGRSIMCALWSIWKCWRIIQNKGSCLFQIYQTLGRNVKAASISHPFQIGTCTETHTYFHGNYSQSEFDLTIAP